MFFNLDIYVDFLKFNDQIFYQFFIYINKCLSFIVKIKFVIFLNVDLLCLLLSKVKYVIGKGRKSRKLNYLGICIDRKKDYYF